MQFNIALIGNPNSGKSSVFNQLTGLRQKVANFPGVTVDKKIGQFEICEGVEVNLVDFPGTYSMYPTTSDEKVVTAVLTNPQDESYPDLIVFVADVTSLEKHLLLLTQVKDLGIPIVFALNMMDLAQKAGYEVQTEALKNYLDVPIIAISGRYGTNIDLLKTAILTAYRAPRPLLGRPLYALTRVEQQVVQQLTEIVAVRSSYQALVIAHHYKWLPFLTNAQREKITDIYQNTNYHDLRGQINETMKRFDHFTPIVKTAIQKEEKREASRTDKLDAIFTHRFWGPFIFFAVMLLVFQSIFSVAEVPKGWIEDGMGWLNEWVKTTLPDAWYTSLLTDGLIAGLGGVLVFVPQITILFLLISLLEELGYMARAVFMFDNIMQRFGLNGRSIVSLISGGACAVPAIMATRTIENRKERLITIMVTPLISCSARIPVYAVLVGFVVPPTTVLGIFNAQALVFMGLYLLGIAAALLSGFVFKKILKSEETSSLMIELPMYRPPLMKNVLLSVREKVMSFVLNAGKIILFISLILWVLSYFGPGDAKQNAEAQARIEAVEKHFTEAETNDLIAAKAIEASYAGHIGKFIEPAIRPLGFDWKIGIALITSIAAREVFVGTMATIYSVGSAQGDQTTIREKMATEINPITQKPVYSFASSLSLLLFYAFAMQCMSTIAIVRRETGSWKWAIIQFFFMTGLAYLSGLVVFQVFG